MVYKAHEECWNTGDSVERQTVWTVPQNDALNIHMFDKTLDELRPLPRSYLIWVRCSVRKARMSAATKIGVMGGPLLLDRGKFRFSTRSQTSKYLGKRRSENTGLGTIAYTCAVRSRSRYLLTIAQGSRPPIFRHLSCLSNSIEAR